MEQDETHSILDEILNAQPEPSPERRFRWFEQLPDSAKAHFLQAKSLWKAGTIRMTAHAMSKRVMVVLRTRGLPAPASHTSISDWLRQ